MNSEPLLPVKTAAVRESQLPRITLVLFFVTFVIIAFSQHVFYHNDRLLSENDRTLAVMQNEIEEQVMRNTKAIAELTKKLGEHEEQISLFEMMFTEPESDRPDYDDVIFTDEMILASAAGEGESPESDVTGAAADHKPTQQNA